MTTRKKYDKAFKEQTALLILSGERTVREMAEEIGVHYTTVRDWVQDYKCDGGNAFPGNGRLKPEDEEIRKLQPRLADLEKESAILKKAAAYFAKRNKQHQGG